MGKGISAMNAWNKGKAPGLRSPRKLLAAALSLAMLLLTPLSSLGGAFAAGADSRTQVVSPAYRSDLVAGSVTVSFTNAQGAYAKAYSQKQPADLSAASNGTKELVAEVALEGGAGSFEFPAAEYPNGPVSIRIDVFKSAAAAPNDLIDTAYAQFYNKAGVDWRAGLDNAPQNPVTQRMSVTYADDFAAMPSLSVAGNGLGDTGAAAADAAHGYATRKIDEQRGGMFGWSFFADNDGTKYDPFSIVDGEYMKLTTTYWPEGGVPGAAGYWGQKSTTGYLSSMGQDGSGFHTSGGHNQYFEARIFTGTNPALWPAFWLLTANGAVGAENFGGASDEIDIVEGYLGSPSGYQATGHQWGYDTGKGAGSWPSFETADLSNINIAMGFHTFAALITENRTYYYCDNVEVFSHDTLEKSWELGSYFIINGGVSDHFGRPKDGSDTFGPDSEPLGFTRYGNECYTYVDWVRVWEDDDATPRFEAASSSVRALPGDYVALNVKRNGAAQLIGGTYEVALPSDGWLIWDESEGAFEAVGGASASAGFAAGAASDLLLFKAPDSVAEGSGITVSVIGAGGESISPALRFALLTEGEHGTEVAVNRQSYPYRNTGGGGAGGWTDYDPAANEQQYFTYVSGGWWSEAWSWMHNRVNNNPVLEFSFHGNAFELYTIDFDDGRPITISLDGVEQAVYDTRSASEATNLAWRWEDAGGADADHTVRIVASPAGDDYGGFVRMETFKYWYHEDASKPKYTIENTYFEATPDGAVKPGDVIEILVDRNAATGSTYGAYSIELPEYPEYGDAGYKLVSADSLNNRPQDTIKIQLPSDAGWLGKFDTISINAPAGSGFGKTLQVTVKSPDPADADPIPQQANTVKVDSSGYPFVRASDGGKEGSWATFDKRTQEFDYFSYNGNWWSDSWGWMYVQSSDGNWLDFNFEGDAVALYAEYHTEGPQYELYLDGEFQGAYDSKGSTSGLRVFSASGLEAGEHVLRVLLRGPGYMKLTGFEYNYVPSALPKLVAVNKDTYPSSGNGNWSTVQNGTYFSNINGGWWKDDTWMYVRGDASIDFNFTGTEAWVYGGKFSGSGKASFYIDGDYAGEADLYDAADWPGQANALLFSEDGLLPAPHALTVKFEAVGDRNLMRVDEFAYMSTPRHEAIKLTATESLAGARGETLEIAVTRNGVAQAYSGYYEVTLPEGWELVGGAVVDGENRVGFEVGSAEDTIGFRVSASEFAAKREVTVQPIFTGGAGTGKGSALVTQVRLDKATPPDIVSLASPEYRAEIEGMTTLEFIAPGGYAKAEATSVHAPDAANPDQHGYLYKVGPVVLDGEGNGAITFDADALPHGPVSVRVVATKADGKTQCDGYFQFYNNGGENWQVGLDASGLPESVQQNQAELGKAELVTVFADDFESAPSITRTGAGATYAAHKPDYGDYGGALFAGPENPLYNPFSQVEDYLKIVTKYYEEPLPASVDGYRRNYTTGFLSSAGDAGHSYKKLDGYENWDGWTNGYTEQYLEARFFVGPNPGSWPAFWTLSNGPVDGGARTGWRGCDELDIAEIWMPSPNYSLNTHEWSYTTYDPETGAPVGGGNSINMSEFLGETGDIQMGFHTYGCYITEDYTYYYLDNVLIHTEKTLPLSWRDGNFFMVNGAIDQTKESSFPDGYGFTRYGDQCDMYVDFVRVWEAPKSDAPIFDVDYDGMEIQAVSPGGTLTINVNRANDAAKALAGSYAVEAPAGWTVISGESFAAGSAADAIVLGIPANYLSYDANVKVTPIVGGEAAARALTVMTRNTDNSFAVEIYPIYNKDGGWDVAVELINSADGVLPAGSVAVTFPDGSTGDYPFGEIAAYGKQTVTVEDAPVNINSLQDFKFSVTREDGFARVIDRALSSLTAVYEEDIDISGSFAAETWQGAMKAHLSGEQFTGSWSGEDDSSADLYTKWDGENLYIAAAVKDDVHIVNTNAPDSAWACDSIQLSFDPLRAGGYADGDHHIRLTGGVMQDGSAKLYNETYLYNGKTVGDMDLNFYRDEAAGTTYYALAIPWAAILPDGQPVADRTDVGFTIMFNDLDGADGRGWISYMYGIATGKDPSQFGDLILTDEPAADVSREPVGVSAANAKAVYDFGEAFDAGSLTVKLNYSDGSFDVIGAGDYEVSGYDAAVVGAQEITVSYGGFTAAFTVTVLEADAKLPTGIAIASLPTRVDGYLKGEPLDYAGLVVKLIYSDGDVAELAYGADYALSYDFGVSGHRQVTVSYGAFEAAFSVNVLEGEWQPPASEALYADFDYTINGVEGNSFTPDTYGLWARNYYEYGDYDKSGILVSGSSYNDTYIPEDIYGQPALTVLGANANERIRFGIASDAKDGEWYDPEGTFLTVSLTYYDYDGSGIEDYSGIAEIGFVPVGGMWNYNYPSRTMSRSLPLSGDGSWKTYTATIFAQANSYDEGMFSLELKGNRVLPISRVEVSPATEEEIAAAAIPIGLEIDEAASKTQYDVGEQHVHNDLKVYLVYSDGYRESLAREWEWQGNLYVVEGFDSSEEAVLTLTVKNGRTLDAPRYWTTIDVTIGDGVPPADKAALEGIIAEALGFNLALYTPASAEALSAALEGAQALYGDDNAAQDDVDAAALALENAIAGLVVAADKTELAALVDKTGAIVPDIFDSAAADAFAAARQAAQGALDDANAAQADADAACAALDGALGALSAENLSSDYAGYGVLVELLLKAAKLDGADYEADAWADFMEVVNGAWGFVAEALLAPASEGAVFEAGALLAALEEAAPADADADEAAAETGEEAEAGLTETAAETTETEETAEIAETAETAAAELGTQSEPVLEPFSYYSAPALINWIKAVQAALDELSKHPASVPPTPSQNVAVGVHAQAATIAEVEEHIGDDGLQVEFEVRGTGLDNVGSLMLQLSYRVEDFEELDVDGFGNVLSPGGAFTLPDGLAASVMAVKTNTPDNLGEDGEYVTYLVYVKASAGSLVTVAPNAPVLGVRLAAKEYAYKRVELLLNMVDVAYYSGGEGPFHAVESITRPYASTLLDVWSLYDINRDGEFTLLDLELVRKNLGAKADEATGEWESEEAKRCDVAGKPDDVYEDVGDGAVDLSDLTRMLAKYAATYQ
jgi:beta-glucanase (GH16 family)